MNSFEYEIFSEELGSSSSSSSSSSDAGEGIAYDPAYSPRFITASAERQYQRSIQRHVMIERQFEAPTRTFEEAIRFHNWAYLTMAPVAVNMPLVREFYANANASQSKSVFLRGTFLQVTRHHINLHYLLPDYPYDTYTRLVEAENTDHLLNAVGFPGATWVREGLIDPVSKAHKFLKAQFVQAQKRGCWSCTRCFVGLC